MRKTRYRRKTTKRTKAPTKRNYAKRNTRRGRFSRYNRTLRIPYGLPERMRTTLSYCIDRQTLSAGAGGASTGALKFRVNGPFDPEYAAGGAQPPLWDNYNAIYAAYIVNAVTVYARVENWSSTPLECVLICMFDPTTNTPSFPDSISTYDINALGPTQRSRIKFAASASGAAGNVQMIKKKFIPKQIVGRNYYSDVTYAGLSAGLPGSEVIGELLVRSQDALLGAWGAWVNLRLEYDVTFYDRRETEIAAYD